MALSKSQSQFKASGVETPSVSMLRQPNVEHREKSLRQGWLPLSISWGLGETETKISFADKVDETGSCIRCVNPPCMEFRREELKVDAFKEFPSDGDIHVCPTEAIQWDTTHTSPVVRIESCISCGLCVTRCPVGAIHLESDGAHINDAPNAAFVETGKAVEAKSNLALQKRFASLPRQGRFLSADYDRSLEDITARILTMGQNFSSQFPKRVARNLLMGVGVSCAMRRLGDVNLRMDLFFEAAGIASGTGSVELGDEVLDAPRNLLDSIAVLCHRYTFKKEEITPLVVTGRLPNRRAEYWGVIGDISKVMQVDIRIRSLTFAALILLIWNQKRLDLTDGRMFFADDSTKSIRHFIEEILGREIVVADGSRGLFDAFK